ncbi:fibronectin type III domain-containing protein [Sphingobacterium haloxyli]|uniref:Fibronectin type-III domain-containing protein n=1 Tax=Sphingobacterium haloxyli TaxID=2100533 RepID=A0A2S9J953_9SPHI|nr:DUF4957 domain-containing protein [Sphingobacterium haloxyli]PRD49301.1 hypothetical protein C5745_01370 [Sphingobacterium haloxyli]
MKAIFLSKGHLLFLWLTVCFIGCKKDNALESNQTDPIQNLRYIVQGEHAKVAWDPSEHAFSHYTIELSRLADFSVLNQTQTVDNSAQEYVFWKLDPGEDYYCRIKRVKDESETEWSTVNFNTSESNILVPVQREDVDGDVVRIRWDPISTDIKLSKITLKPTLGLIQEHMLSPTDLGNKYINVGDLDADMAYEVRLYDGDFVVGKTSFVTMAVPVNGVWTLSPHSDLITAIETSAPGDRLLLNPGVYDLSTLIPRILDKVISLEGLDETDMPQLYARNFLLTGARSGISFKNLNISGARIDEYNTELPNSQDHLWNTWLVSLDEASANLDAITFDNCVIGNYSAGLFQMNDNNRPPHKVGNAIAVNNCVVYDLGADNDSPTLRINAAQVLEIAVTNSTFYRTNRLFVKIDAERNPANVIDFTFRNNTVHDSWAGGSFDFLAVKAPSKFLLENNNLSDMTSSGNFFPNFAYVANDFDKRIINTNFFNVLSKSTIYGSNQSNMPVHSWELRHPNTRWNEVLPAFIMNDDNDENPNSIQAYTVSYDPGYADADNGDFTVSASSALRAVDGGNAIGDPRWW